MTDKVSGGFYILYGKHRTWPLGGHIELAAKKEINEAVF